MKGLKINYDKTFATKYSRDYYRGASFHYSGKWAAGVHYVADSYNTDFCASHQVLLACKLSHTSDEYNDPAKHFIYDEDQNIIGIKSKYWDIVIAGINIIGETKEWVDERIDGVIEAYKADIEFSARGLRTEFTHDIDDAVNGVTRNYRSEISQTAEEIRSTVEAVETSLDGKMEENYSELKQRADSISATVAQNKSDIEGNLEQKYSELKMTADEIATTVSDVKTDLEGNISNKFSEISQRADQISARVEEVNSNLNGDLEEKYSELKMTADEITSTVAANKTELDNTIQENYSQLSQRADSITATVAQNRSDLEGSIEQKYSEMVMTADEISTTVAKNKADLEGNVDSKFSEVSQKADEIAARVEEVSQQSTGELEKKYSELIMTTDAISATVAANKTATDGSISDLNSNITQTATEIRSEVNRKITDVDGKVEEAKSSISQTADQIMATVEANKTELDGTISANYSELKQTAEEISATVTANKNNVDGNIANLRSDFSITAEQIRSEVAAEVETINGEISNTRSSITQTAGQIRSEVDAHVETLEGAISDTNSSITLTADQIRSEVNETITNTTTNITNAYTSAIDQKADSITSSVKATTDALGGRISSAESTITQHADQIASKVSQDAYNADKDIINSRFSAIEQDTSGIHQSVTAIDGKIDETAEELASTLAGAVNDLQNQIDGAVETYHGNAEPTLQNYPASDWSSSDYEKHVGDMYYDKTTGYAYRFTEENDNYYWDIIRDSGITEAIAKANDKGKIFIDTPYTPYKVGDLWVQGHKTGNDGTIYRCLTTRETGNYSAADWGPACDFETMKVSRANLDILSNAIIGQVAAIQYNSDGTIKEESRSAIQQTAGNIRLSVANGAIDTAVAADGTIANKMLGTGIDITNGIIVLTANNIKMQGNTGNPYLLCTEIDGKPVIKAENLQLSGVLSLSGWNDGKTALEQYAEGKANTAQQNAIDTASTDATNKANTAEANAKGYADTKKTEAIAAAKVYSDSTDYLNSIKGTITAGFATTESVNNAIAGLDYLKAALTEESTVVQGGLVLSSLIQLGSGAKTSSWQVWSGLNGQIASGHSVADTIAFWAGGDMTESGSRAAKAVIRMDGTGYLAGGNISWDTSGNATFNGEVVASKFTISNDAQVTGLDVSKVSGAATSAALNETNLEVVAVRNLANGKADPSDIADSNTLMAQKLGFADYNAFKNAAAANSTIINGGYINTQLIQANAITADMINATNLHVNSANIDGTITATNLNAATGTFTGTLSGADGTFTGTLSAATGSFSGSITAASGNIGGWTIQPNYLDLDDPDNGLHKLRLGYWYDGPEDKRYVFAAGEDWADSDGFNFAIDDEGHMYASGANIYGRIESSEGQIGGFTISTSKLYNGLSTLNGTSNGVYLGTDGIALGGGKFKVTKAGLLTATNAKITGTITASAGSIGMLHVKEDGGGLWYGSQNDDHTTTEFELNPDYLMFSRTDDGVHGLPIAYFRVDVTGDSTSVCDIDTSHGADIIPLTIELGQQQSAGICISTYASNDKCDIYPDYIEFGNGNKIGKDGITYTTGMFSGLRPNTIYLNDNSSYYLGSLDYNIIVNNSSSKTLYLPGSPQNGQTYFIVHQSNSPIYIQRQSSKTIYSISAQQDLTSATFGSRGTLLIMWNGTKWICDILSSY